VLVAPEADEIVGRWQLPSGAFELAWFGDGRRLCLLGGVEPGGQGGDGLFVLDRDRAEPRLLTRDLDACPVALVEAGARPLAAVARGLDTFLASVGDDGLTELIERTGPIEFLSASADGSVVAVVAGGPAEPYDVWSGPPGGPLARISDVNPELRQIEWGPSERLSWRAADGLELDGLLVLPPGARRSDGPFRLFTLVHGGPYGRFPDSLVSHPLAPAQWLAHAGWAVFMPNPRGGLGHGVAFASSVRGAVGMEDWQDIVAGLDTLVEARVMGSRSAAGARAAS
jgi:dipeptidyl aminopeptidase/acylaminoacyl peptidase